jgi:Tfp pilus assembly protein PilO
MSSPTTVLGFDLKRIPIKPIAKALFSMKNLNALGVLIFVCYFVGYDNFYRPNAEKLATLQEAITQRQTELSQKKQQSENAQDIGENLKELAVTLPTLDKDTEPNILAATAVNQVYEFITDPQKRTVGEVLPANLAKLELVALKKSDGKLVNVFDEKVPAPRPSQKNAVSQLSSGEDGPSSFNLWKFDYQLTVRGPYIAMADLMNDMVSSRQLLVINQISLKPSDTDASQQTSLSPPTADTGDTGSETSVNKAKPGTPVEMSLLFSIYLLDPRQADE